MNSRPPQGTTAATISGMLFFLSLLFCSTELVPAWGIFGLGWPPAVYYGIMGLVGAIGGGLLTKYPLAGIPSGAVAGIGALLAQAFLLQRVVEISNLILVLFTAMGALPGVFLYYALLVVFLPPSAASAEAPVVEPEPDTPAPEPQHPAEARPRRLAGGDTDPNGCPACGSDRFWTKHAGVLPGPLLVRTCLDCGTRYSPRIPFRVSFLYLILGLVFLTMSVVIWWVEKMKAEDGRLRLGREFLIMVGAAAVGVVCLVVAARGFFRRSQN